MIERLTISDKLEIVSLIDPFPDEESQKIAKNHNLEIYKDFDEALSLSKSDAIILCTPNSFHMEQTIKASKLGSRRWITMSSPPMTSGSAFANVPKR